jgi:hypothetical protein
MGFDELPACVSGGKVNPKSGKEMTFVWLADQVVAQQRPNSGSQHL